MASLISPLFSAYHVADVDVDIDIEIDNIDGPAN
jgi:hypothetical protein